jgi:hypothetical protein
VVEVTWLEQQRRGFHEEFGDDVVSEVGVLILLCILFALVLFIVALSVWGFWLAPWWVKVSVAGILYGFVRFVRWMRAAP